MTKKERVKERRGRRIRSSSVREEGKVHLTGVASLPPRLSVSVSLEQRESEGVCGSVPAVL